MFMKNNMPRDENTLGMKVVQLVTFNGIRIANKDTRYSPMIKFGSSASQERSIS
jgi:hypothetical protein